MNPFKSEGLVGFVQSDHIQRLQKWRLSPELKGWQLLNVLIVNAVYLSGSVSSLSPLLQAAVLIVQQMQRGLGLVKSFYRACWEVYGRSQQLESNQKVKVLYLKVLLASSR